MKFKVGDKVLVNDRWRHTLSDETPLNDFSTRGTIIPKKPHDGLEENYYRIRYDNPKMLEGLGYISSSLYHKSRLKFDLATIRYEKINKVV